MSCFGQLMHVTFFSLGAQCLWIFLGIISCDPCVLKSNQLHVDIFRCFYLLMRYMLTIHLKWLIISLNLSLVNWNWLFLKVNRFICNWQSVLPLHCWSPACSVRQIQIEPIATFLIIFRAHTNLPFVFKVKILVLIKWSYILFIIDPH